MVSTAKGPRHQTIAHLGKLDEPTSPAANGCRTRFYFGDDTTTVADNREHSDVKGASGMQEVHLPGQSEGEPDSDDLRLWCRHWCADDCGLRFSQRIWKENPVQRVINTLVEEYDELRTAVAGGDFGGFSRADDMDDAGADDSKWKHEKGVQNLIDSAEAPC